MKSYWYPWFFRAKYGNGLCEWICSEYVKWRINWNILETAANYSQKQIIFLISMVLFSASAVLSVIGTRMKNSKSSIRFKKLTAIIYLNMVGGIVLGTVEIIKLGQYESFSVAMIALSLFLPFSFFYKSTNLFKVLNLKRL